MKIQQLGHWIRHFLNQPKKVALFCLLFVIVSSTFNGVLWRLWALHRDHERRSNDMLVAQADIKQLKEQLQQAKDPVYIERQARDRLDLASENDLVFVFPTQ